MKNKKVGRIMSSRPVITTLVVKQIQVMREEFHVMIRAASYYFV